MVNAVRSAGGKDESECGGGDEAIVEIFLFGGEVAKVDWFGKADFGCEANLVRGHESGDRQQEVEGDFDDAKKSGEFFHVEVEKDESLYKPSSVLFRGIV